MNNKISDERHTYIYKWMTKCMKTSYWSISFQQEASSD